MILQGSGCIQVPVDTAGAFFCDILINGTGSKSGGEANAQAAFQVLKALALRTK